MARVCHFTSVHASDDIRIFHKECSSLSDAGFDVSIVATRGGPVPPQSDVDVHLVEARSGRGRRMFWTSAAVARRAAELDADIYHFHDSELIPHGIRLALAGRRVIYDVHESLSKAVLSKDYLPKATRRTVALGADVAEWAMAQTASAIVAATPAIARQFPDDKTEIVQNFPLLGELVPPSDFFVIDRSKTVIYTGSISAVRGAVEMVEAMGRATGEPRLTLVGSFARPETERRVRASAGWGRVDYAGWLPRSELQARLATARVGLVLFLPEPNHIEAMPNKLFEYMSAGLPVIASDFPLWREIVDSVGCGLLANPEDPGDIARAVDWLLAHPEQAEEMGVRGRRAVEVQYNWATESHKLVDLYRRLLA